MPRLCFRCPRIANPEGLNRTCDQRIGQLCARGWDSRERPREFRLEGRQGWAYSTVKTMLDRLVEMGYVKARRVGNVYEYSPKSKRPTVIGRMVDDVTVQLFDGSVAPFIQCLIERGKMTAEEVEELRAMLENYSDEKESKS